MRFTTVLSIQGFPPIYLMFLYHIRCFLFLIMMQRRPFLFYDFVNLCPRPDPLLSLVGVSIRLLDSWMGCRDQTFVEVGLSCEAHPLLCSFKMVKMQSEN
jgi:hypothetical protein